MIFIEFSAGNLRRDRGPPASPPSTARTRRRDSQDSPLAFLRCQGAWSRSGAVCAAQGQRWTLSPGSPGQTASGGRPSIWDRSQDRFKNPEAFRAAGVSKGEPAGASEAGSVRGDHRPDA